MANTQNVESQCKVAQLYAALCSSSNPKVTKRVLEKTVDINCKLPGNIFPVHSEFKLECHTLLHVPYVKGSIENFELLLKYGADFTIKDQRGSTVLHHIIKNIQEEIVNLRVPLANAFINAVLSAHVEFGNHVNPGNRNGLSHFHVATMANKVEVVKLFVDNGTPIDQMINMDSLIKPGYSPLHLAAEHSCYETIEFLILNGANMHLKNANGMMPLHLLIKQRLRMTDSMCVAVGTDVINVLDKEIQINERIISILLENDSTDTESTDHIGLLKFHVACTFNDSVVLKCFLDRIVNINQRVNEDSPVWPGYTGLHFAAHCNIKTVKLLIEEGADMTARDAKGTTPLDICMRWFRAEDMLSISSLMPHLQNITFIPYTQTEETLSKDKTKLLDYIFAMLDPDKLLRFLHGNVDFNMRLPKESPLWPNSTPLHLAFRSNKDEVVSSLLKLHTKAWIEPINLSDENCLTHLHIGCTYNCNLDCYAMKILSSKPSDKIAVNVVYNGQPLTKLRPGSTPLHAAVTTGRFSLVKTLLGHAADVNRKDAEGFSPVHRIFKTNWFKIANLLLGSKQLEESVVEEVGLTHLHVATRFRNDKAIQRLLRMGAKVEATIASKPDHKDLRDVDGCTPLHLAVTNEDAVSATLLLKFGADVLAKRSNGASPLSEALTIRNDVILNAVVKSIYNDQSLRRRLEEELGLTMLHVACRTLDVDKIKILLTDEDVDVNARTRDDLNFWPGFTPLHVLIDAQFKHVSKERVFVDTLEMLLMNGADVTVNNADGCTPVHLASTMRKIEPVTIASMLKSQRDLTVDPLNENGVSHFHCACAFGDLESVKKFLLQDHLDINRQVSLFASKYAGYAPLHFAVSSIENVTKLKDEETQRCIIALLLARGAKVNTQDSRGNTALHILIRETEIPQRFSLMSEILSFSGKEDMNLRNIDGQTPLEVLLTNFGAVNEIDVCLEELKLLIASGSYINTCNPVTNEGYIALALSLRSSSRELFHAKIIRIIEQASGLSGSDEINRNGIHNCLMPKRSKILQETYEKMIEACVRYGCDIDQQDIYGNTPLHLAVKFGNEQAIAALLVSGADINVIDLAGKSPFSCHFESCRRPNDCISWILVWHVYELKLLEIHINELNETVLTNALKEYHVQKSLKHLYYFNKAVRLTEAVKIGRRGLTLRNLLFETTIINYPSLTLAERSEVIALFESLDYSKYQEAKFVLKLQYKKVLQMMTLIADAENIFKTKMSIPFPELCASSVVKFLRRSDLENFVAAFVEEDDLEMHVN